MKGRLNIIISGGGTGGHIFPALAIADALRERYPSSNIRFVGALGRMEMEKVPQNGYPIDGIHISGFQRKNILKNVGLPFKLVGSLLKVNTIITKYKPDIAIGVGGFASGPMLFMASMRGVPTLIQEQNSFPGVTNKILGKRAKAVCVAYPNMEKYFPNSKVVFTGNPVRKFQAADEKLKAEAYKHFGFDRSKPVVFITGGSLGARTLNDSISQAIEKLRNTEIQFIWQTGKFYFEKLKNELGNRLPQNIKMLAFIDRMDYAYAISDIVVSRAGALSISEMAILGKVCILVPSPNVAEDHQTKNAKVLTDSDAALMVSDDKAKEDLVDTILNLAKDAPKRAELSLHIKKFAKPNATDIILEELEKIINK